MKQIITCICFAVITNCEKKNPKNNKNKNNSKLLMEKLKNFQFHAAVENDMKGKLLNYSNFSLYYFINIMFFL